MTTFITGGTGRTGGALAKLLHDADRPFLVASRTGKAPAPYKAVEFDFAKAETYKNPFVVDSSIDRIYLVPPPLLGPDPVISFIDFAISKGIKRFVLLSSSLTEPEADGGEIHKHLIDTGVDLTVLRPTWYFQNFTWAFIHATIKEHNQTFSATADGKIPFVSTEDVGQAAFDALTAEKSPNKSIFVLGPELLSYAEVSKLLSSVLGHEITHKRYTADELADTLVQFGVPLPLSKGLAGMEDAASKGSEEASFNGPAEKFIGKRTLLEFFEVNKAILTK